MKKLGHNPVLALLALCSYAVTEQVAQAKGRLSIRVIILDSLILSRPNRYNSDSGEHLIKCRVPYFVWAGLESLQRDYRKNP